MSAFTGENEEIVGGNESNVAFRSTPRTLINSIDVISCDVSESNKWERMCTKTADLFDLLVERFPVIEFGAFWPFRSSQRSSDFCPYRTCSARLEWTECDSLQYMTI